MIWDLPKGMNFLLLIFLGVTIISFIRMLNDLSGIYEYYILRNFAPPLTTNLINDYFVNSFKWLIPSVLLFYGCNSRNRLILGIAACLLFYFFIGIQVIRHMPPHALLDAEYMKVRALKMDRMIGFHRVDVSMMLAGASWSFFIFKDFFSKNIFKIGAVLLAILVAYAQALTAGRAGYATWIVVGFTICLMRYKKYLLVVPLILLVFISFFPGPLERLTEGFYDNDREPRDHVGEYSTSDEEVDIHAVLAGRNLAWPYVVAKIQEAPFIGFGRMAMIRTGIASRLWREYQDTFPHPHNAYLELLLDTGIIGALPILIMYCLFLKRSFSLFMDKKETILMVTGGLALCLLLSNMVAAIGAQTFYPRESTTAMWCAISLMMRVWINRERGDKRLLIQNGSVG
jgi:O-antigen ligase